MINLPDIAGSNSVVNLGDIAQAQGAVRFTARWVQCVAAGAGTARIGGPNVSAILGLPVIASGGSQFFPAISSGDAPPPYSLNGIYAYVPAGCTLSVAYEPYN